MIRVVLLVLLLPTFAMSQNEKLHIGDGVSNPNAILQVDSNSKGVLIPRMTSAERNAIVSPMSGLMVYDVVTASFWYYKGFEWTELYSSTTTNISSITDSDGIGSVEVEQANIDDDVIKFKVNNSTRMEMSTDQLRLDLGMFIWMRSDQSALYGFNHESATQHFMHVGGSAGGLRGDNSVSIGDNVNVAGDNGLSFGSSSSFGQVMGTASTIFGNNNKALGTYGTSFGSFNETDGLYATSWGANTEALANGCLAWGAGSSAISTNATAWGTGSEANAIISTAFGSGIANGVGSVAWGNTEANGNYAMSWGRNNIAYTENEVVLGHDTEDYTFVNGTQRLFVVGSGYNVFEVRKDNSARFKGDLILVGGDVGEVSLGLKEETNGQLFGYEFGYDGATEDLHFRSKGFSGNDAIRMTVNANNNLGIGMNAVSNRLEVNGNASKAVAGPWLANSDRRLKKNIKKMNSQRTLDKVLKMQGVTYVWNDDKSDYERPIGIQYGFIAQDLQKIWPKKVSVDGLGYLQTAYGDFDFLFVGAFKNQQERINKLEDENETMDSAVDDLSEQNKALLEELTHLENLLSKLETNFKSN